MFASTREFLGIVLRQFISRPARVAVAALMLLLSSAALILIPVATSGVINGISRSSDIWSATNRGPVLMLIVVVATWLVTSSISSFLQEEGNQRAAMHARYEVCRHWLERTPTADEARHRVISRITADASAFERGLAALTNHAPASLLQVSGALVCMVLLSPTLGLAFIATMAVTVGLLSSFERRLVVLSKTVHSTSAATLSVGAEILTHNRLIRRFMQEPNELERYSSAQRELEHALAARRRAQITARAIVFLSLAASIGGVGFLGLTMVRSESLASGDLVAFFGLGLIIGNAATSLADSVGAIAAAIDPLHRLVEVLPCNRPEGTQPLSRALSPTVGVNGLKFRYEPDGFLLNIPELQVRGGSTIAFVGPSGCGKSTLLRLIAGEEAAPPDRIFINGVDVTNVRREDLLKTVVYFDPVPVILSRSAEDNILFGRERREVDFAAAVSAACAADILEELRGVPTISSAGLSSGQKQRVSIARSLLLRAPVLLMDEATSAVDSRQERNILEGIVQTIPGATTIIVSHRLSAIRQADCVYVLSAGNIVEFGTHDELVQKQGLYLALFRDQLDQRPSDRSQSKARWEC